MTSIAASRAPDWRAPRALALAAIVPVTGVIFAGTLGPASFAEAVCLRLLALAGRAGFSGGYDAVQTVANVVMFVPLGALLAMGTRPSRWPLAVLVPPGVSLGIEWTQHAIPGRVPDGFDVLTNSLGGLAGFVAGGIVVGVVALIAGVATRIRRGSVL